MSTYRVTIDLDFDEAPDYSDVEDYLGDLLNNECLNYTIHTATESYYCDIKGAAHNKTTTGEYNE